MNVIIGDDQRICIHVCLPQVWYIVCDKKLLPVKKYKMDIKVLGKKKKVPVLSHRVTLTFTITYHTIQGKTLDKEILVLHKRKSKHMKSIEIIKNAEIADDRTTEQLEAYTTPDVSAA